MIYHGEYLAQCLQPPAELDDLLDLLEGTKEVALDHGCRYQAGRGISLSLDDPACPLNPG